MVVWVHEFGVARELLRVVADECRERGIERPVKVVACLGELSAYKKEPVIFYYDMLRKETGGVVSSAELEVVMVEGKVSCRRCGKESGVVLPHMVVCALCGSNDVDVVCGKEFFLKEIVGGRLDV